ncbi:VirB4 family type IV secretion/conjugal transfer ATPase (plasmid) [Agrobacterium sp. rho-13.3]|uniref:VirB4 family type IV secretion/conjugal transfer ATPase n=1 Tax=Agrobacterium sp. rho-13.3 TaxID=3072980 RepID=UPI002A12B1F7|nr:VirB4 family type IV secretion/conjugal transfer ATPase [Agrobacterium sp. rho-13.3]MDX8311706.1 VirB4 family type IV secretion/conjugal transfer ATPase [Agrobacterium sp. rho-13.3]
MVKLMGRSRAIQREALASEKLPYIRHIDEHIVSLRNGQMLAVIELEGASFDTADHSEKNDLHAKLNLMWRNINDERLAVWTHLIRTRDVDYPEGTFKSDFAKQLDDKCKRKMTSETLYRNRLYLALVWAPARDANKPTKSLVARLGKARKTGTEVDEKGLRDFRGILPTIVTGLDRYEARLCGLYEHNGFMFSQVSEYLNAVGTLSFEKMPLTEGPISGAILLDRPLFGREVIELRGAGQSRYCGVLGVKEYPATTRPGMLNDLLQAPFEFVLSQSFAMASKTESRSILTLKQNQMTNVKDRALSQIVDLDQALDDLESSKFTMGRHHLNLMVVADSAQTLMDKMAIARRMMSDCSIVTSREDLALEAAYWGQFPGNFNQRPRSGHISSRNFAALSPFMSYPKGDLTNPWGPSIALLKTSSGCGFHLNLHVGDLGNTFICGPSGSGKTVLQNFILAQLQKHDVTTVFFDKDRGADIFVRAVGGRYLSLENGRPTGCAPLKVLDLENPDDHAFAVEWATNLISHADGRPLTVPEQKDIDNAILQMRQLPKAQRSLGALRQFLSSNDLEGTAARLERWTSGGPLGWVFDNESDALDLDSTFLGFDMTDFLDNPTIRTPLMMYLFYRIERLIDGRRIVIDIDEFWKALGDPAFRELAQNKLKTIRKQNGLMIFGTQSPRDAIASPIGYTIIEQCPTKIFMPNSAASAADYIEGFGLSHREFELIKTELTVEKRQFLIKQEHNSVVAELSLHGFDDELTILSGRTAAVNRLDEIRAAVGDDPADWMPILLNKRDKRGEAA